MSRLKNRNIRGKLSQISSAKLRPSLPSSDALRSFDESPLKFPEKSNNFMGNLSDNEYANSSSDNTIRPRGSSNEEELTNQLEDSIKSGDSSIGWADDYETKATQLVKDEYDRMERVLQCLEPIPSNYDKDEYSLWIETFPRLRSFRSKSIISAPKMRSSLNLKSVNSSGPKQLNCDRKNSSSSQQSQNSSRKPLNLEDLNQLIDNLYPSGNHTQNSRTTFSNSKNLAVNNTLNPRTLDFKLETSFLQLAPLNVPQPSNSGKKHAYVNQRQGSHSRTANWVRNGSSEINVQRSKSIQNKPSADRRANSDFIVLPPITGKQFGQQFEMRSASAAAITNSFYRPYSKIRMSHPLPLYERKDHNRDESESEAEIWEEPKRKSKLGRLLREELYSDIEKL